MPRVSEQASCENPKVSVAMITYNHEAFIAQAIESVLMQETDFPVELVIGEDCSTDGTRRIVKAYAEKYPNVIHVLIPERNLGMQRNFRAVLALCRGQYIACLEGDDAWLPKKIQRQVDILEKQPKTVALVYSDALQMDENGVLLPQTFIQTREHISDPPGGNVFRDLWKGNFMLVQASLFRKEVFDSSEQMDDLYDWDLLLRISKAYKVVYSPVPSVKYRIHANSIMRQGASQMDKLRALVRLKYMEQDPALATPELVDWLASQLYRMGHSKRHHYLWKRLCLKCTRLNLVAYLCSRCGLPYYGFLKVQNCSVKFLAKLRRFWHGDRTKASQLETK